MTITNSVTGGTTAYRIAGGQATGAAPATGTWVTNDAIVDSTGYLWICTAGGTSGTWVQANQTMVGVFHANGGTDTSSTAAMTNLTGLTSGTKFQCSTTQNSTLYITCTTATTLSAGGISIGVTTGTELTIIPTVTTLGKSVITVQVPKAFWVVINTGTIANFTFNYVTC